MGFLRDLFGVVTAEDVPDMSEFAKYIMGLESVRLLLRRDYGDKLPDTYGVIVAYLLTTACYKWHLKDMGQFNRDTCHGYIQWILKRENGRVVVNDSDDNLIAWILGMLSFDIKSRSAFALLKRNLASVRAEIRDLVLDGDIEENVDPELLESYHETRLSQPAIMKLWIKIINSQLDAVS